MDNIYINFNCIFVIKNLNDQFQERQRSVRNTGQSHQKNFRDLIFLLIISDIFRFQYRHIFMDIQVINVNVLE